MASVFKKHINIITTNKIMRIVNENESGAITNIYSTLFKAALFL